jgi:hypothetical protein
VNVSQVMLLGIQSIHSDDDAVKHADGWQGGGSLVVLQRHD